MSISDWVVVVSRKEDGGDVGEPEEWEFLGPLTGPSAAHLAREIGRLDRGGAAFTLEARAVRLLDLAERLHLDRYRDQLAEVQRGGRG